VESLLLFLPLHAYSLPYSKCRKLEAVVWVCASLALWHYGNGEDDTLYILQLHPAINRHALIVAGCLATANGLIFLYVQLYLRMVQGVRKDPELAAPWAVPTAAGTGVMCACSLVYSCWGVWSWLTPMFWLVHLLALVHIISAIPSFGLPAAKVD
jgi:hypothetical protein